MSASIITFANLGKKTNMPTADILPVINKFFEVGELKQVICQINTDFYFSNTVAVPPKLVRYSYRLIEKITGRTFSRRLAEGLFDFFANRKLKPTEVVFFHGGFFLPRTFRRAKALGLITVDITRTAHLETNARLEREEIKLLNITDHNLVFNKLYSRTTHCNEFDYVIAISDFVKETYIKSGYPAERIFVTQIDIDKDRFVPAAVPPDNIFRVLCLADFTLLKGLTYLLKAWNDLKLDKAELVLVGARSALSPNVYEKFFGKSSNNHSVVVVDHTDHPQDFYSEASVFVFPSLTEGFGRVTLEAMSSGLPVITTHNAKGLVEDGQTGFVVPIRDAEALKEKILYFYNNQEEAREMGKRARFVIENKRPFGETVHEIYQEILRREKML